MRRIGLGVVVMAIASSCSKEPESLPVPKAEAHVIVIRVAGMQKGEGGKT